MPFKSNLKNPCLDGEFDGTSAKAWKAWAKSVLRRNEKNPQIKGNVVLAREILEKGSGRLESLVNYAKNIQEKEGDGDG